MTGKRPRMTLMRLIYLFLFFFAAALREAMQPFYDALNGEEKALVERIRAS